VKDKFKNHRHGSGLKKVDSDGRPSHVLLEKKRKLIGAIHLGATYEDSAVFSGIPAQTLYDWLERAKKDRALKRNNEYTRFLTELEVGLQTFKVNSLSLINRAGIDDWKAVAWLLERRFRKEWGSQSAVELSGPNKGPIQTQNITVQAFMDVGWTPDEVEVWVASGDKPAGKILPS